MSTNDHDVRLQRLVERQDRLDARKALVRRQQEAARSTTAATGAVSREADLARAFESVGLGADAAAVAARGRHAQPQTLADAASLLGIDAQRAQTFAKGRS